MFKLEENAYKCIIVRINTENDNKKFSVYAIPYNGDIHNPIPVYDPATTIKINEKYEKLDNHTFILGTIVFQDGTIPVSLEEAYDRDFTDIYFGITDYKDIHLENTDAYETITHFINDPKFKQDIAVVFEEDILYLETES